MAKRSFQAEVEKRLEMPMNSPYSLTWKLFFWTALGMGLVWFFGATSFVVGGCCGIYIYHFIKWISVRSRIRQEFVMLTLKTRSQFPDVDPEDIITTAWSTWMDNDMPRIILRAPDPPR